MTEPVFAADPTRLLIAAAVGIILLLLLIIKFKIHPVLSLVISALFIGLGAGMPVPMLVSTVEKGAGDTLQGIVLLIGLGSLFGGILEVSGGAQCVAQTLINKFGESKAGIALGITGLVVGTTVFFEAGVVILIPLAFGLAKKTKKSTLYYAALDSALSIGNAILSAGGEGPEAVMAVVNYFENNPLFNAGKGATCTSAGTFELDASIMEGKDLTAGAVAGLKTVKNPINAAYAVKTKTPHVMLAGEGADRFAKSQGLEIVDNMYFATPKTLKWIEDLKKESKKNGTVGCVVLDKQGNLTAGTSTGGMFKKQWGRVGDSPVIGAGTYADNEGCAVSCTGHGEYFIRHVVAYNLSTRVKLLHQPVGEAADYIIHQELNTKEGNGGLIAVDKKGNFAMPFNSGGMFRGYLYKEKGTGKISKAVGIGKKMKTL